MFCVIVLVFRRYRGSQVPFSCFALIDSFSTVSRASGLVFMFCAPGLVFGDTEGVRSRLDVLRARTHFRRYRWRFLHFHVLRSRTRFRRCGGCRVLFSYFALADSFSAVPRASGPVFMFCAPKLIFGSTDDVGFRFHILRSRTHFWRCGGRRFPFPCFAPSKSFSAVPRESGPVFMFCAPGLIFDRIEGVGSHFHVLRFQKHFRQCGGARVPFSCFCSRTHFRRYRRRRVPFSCFVRRTHF
jgi:hypothetical protein